MESRGSPLIILANRLPIHRVSVKGKSHWERSPGGLVSALTPIVKRSGGVWIGWSGTTGPAPCPFTHDGIAQVPVPFSRNELQRFYYGFCNETIWPLYHDAVHQPPYHQRWWASYVKVNKRFALIAAQRAAPGRCVWVHDYHLQLVPAVLRELRPDLRIGFFLHIPFPPKELFARLPWRRQILDGLLGADTIGFQTEDGAQNFLSVAKRYAHIRKLGAYLQVHGRCVQVGAFPISVDFQRYESTAESKPVIERSEEVRKRLGRGRSIILGVDRLDYTKGIDLRLQAFWELLARRQTIRDCVLVQVVVPSRERLTQYRELRGRIEELVGRINGHYGEVGLAAVHYLHREVPFEELIAMYRAADVMLVTPLCDGMNLVAKEYVATRFDNTGALVLSEFTGAARELRTALQVNPHDIDGMAETVDTALSLSSKELSHRMRRMREVVRRHTVYHWAESFIRTLGAPSLRAHGLKDRTLSSLRP